MQCSSALAHMCRANKQHGGRRGVFPSLSPNRDVNLFEKINGDVYAPIDATQTHMYHCAVCSLTKTLSESVPPAAL
jgi:hypothetical protein